LINRLQNIARELRELIRESDDVRFRLRKERSQIENRIRRENFQVPSSEIQKKLNLEIVELDKKLWGKRITPERVESNLEVILAEVERLARELR